MEKRYTLSRLVRRLSKYATHEVQREARKVAMLRGCCIAIDFKCIPTASLDSFARDLVAHLAELAGRGELRERMNVRGRKVPKAISSFIRSLRIWYVNGNFQCVSTTECELSDEIICSTSLEHAALAG